MGKRAASDTSKAVQRTLFPTAVQPEAPKAVQPVAPEAVQPVAPEQSVEMIVDDVVDDQLDQPVATEQTEQPVAPAEETPPVAPTEETPSTPAKKKAKSEPATPPAKPKPMAAGTATVSIGAAASGAGNLVAAPLKEPPTAPTATRISLGLPETMPLRPEKPSDHQIATGHAQTVTQYMRKLEPYVRAKLTLKMSKMPGVMLQTPLHAQVSPSIAENDAAILKSFKEPLNKDNCLRALQSTGMYEASVPLWKLNLSGKEWEGFFPTSLRGRNTRQPVAPGQGPSSYGLTRSKRSSAASFSRASFHPR